MDIKYIAELTAKAVFSDPNTKLLDYATIQTPTSSVLRLKYAIDGSSKVLFVKLPAENIARPERFIKRLKREYLISNQLVASFSSTSELDTVTPAAYIDEVNGLVTWEIQGQSLQDVISKKLLFRYGQLTPELSRLSELSGKWLNHFHSLDITDIKTNLPEDILSYYKGRLDSLAQNKHSQISKTLTESLTDDFSMWIDEALSNKETNVVLCHNDFSPHNLIVTATGICVLDFSFSTPGFPAFDLACFWHKIEDLKGSPLRGNKGLESIQKTFIDAYGFEFDTRKPDIKLGLARLILSKMLTLLNSRNMRLNRLIENRRRYSFYLSLLESRFERGI